MLNLKLWQLRETFEGKLLTGQRVGGREVGTAAVGLDQSDAVAFVPGLRRPANGSGGNYAVSFPKQWPLKMSTKKEVAVAACAPL